MTSQVDDCKLAALESLTGQLGHIDDLEQIYLTSLGATSLQVNDQWLEVFKLNGATSDNWNTAANQFYIALGAPFLNITDNQHWFWCVNNGAVVAGPAFHAITYNPTTFEMLGVKTGTGDLTEGSTSLRRYQDHENTWRSFLSAVPGYFGGRVVENFSLSSNDISNGVWSKTNSIADDFETLTITGVSGRVIQTRAIPEGTTEGRTYVFSCEIDRNGNTTTDFEVQLRAEGSLNEILRPIDGAVLTGTGYVRWSGAVTFSTPGNTNIRITILPDQPATSGTFKIRNIQVEESTGRIDTTIPSEFIPTTTAAVQKVFANENGNTVDGNGIVTDGVGTILSDLPWFVGQAAEQNDQTYSNDATNWTLTGATASFDQPGLTGAPNTGSLISGTGADVAATPAVTVPVDSNPVVIKTYLRKLTSGNIVSLRTQWVGGDKLTTVNLISGSITASGADASEIIDGGLVWVLLLQFNNNGSRNSIQQRIEPDNAGGIGMMNCEVFNNKTVSQLRRTSPIFTTNGAGSIGVSEPFFDIANHDDAQGLYFMEALVFKSSAELLGDDQAMLHFRELGNTGNSILTTRQGGVSTLIGSNDDAFNRSAITFSIVSGVPFKIALAFNTTDALQQININGNYGSEVAYTGAFLQTAGQPMRLAFDAAAGTFLYRNLRRYDLPYTEAKAKIDELMV